MEINSSIISDENETNNNKNLNILPQQLYGMNIDKKLKEELQSDD